MGEYKLSHIAQDFVPLQSPSNPHSHRYNVHAFIHSSSFSWISTICQIPYWILGSELWAKTSKISWTSRSRETKNSLCKSHAPSTLAQLPCVLCWHPLSSASGSVEHQIPIRRGEMGPLPSSVLCSHLGPKAFRALVPGASAGLLPASDLALLTYSIKDHQQSKLLALPEK